MPLLSDEKTEDQRCQGSGRCCQWQRRASRAGRLQAGVARRRVIPMDHVIHQKTNELTSAEMFWSFPKVCLRHSMTVRHEFEVCQEQSIFIIDGSIFGNSLTCYNLFVTPESTLMVVSQSFMDLFKADQPLRHSTRTFPKIIHSLKANQTRFRLFVLALVLHVMCPLCHIISAVFLSFVLPAGNFTV